MWRKASKNRGPDTLLTVNTDTVIDDKRVEVLHESGGEVYVLMIMNLTAHDSGLYSCELNTSPPTVSRLELRVLPVRRVIHLKQDRTDLHDDDDEEDEDDYDYEGYFDDLEYEDEDTVLNYIGSHQDKLTQCCNNGNVSKSCMNWCDFTDLFY